MDTSLRVHRARFVQFDLSMVATSVGVMNESEVAVANTPIVDPALIACLRSDFDDAGWYVDALKQVVSQRALTALGREQRVPALVELRAQTAPISVLTRLFMLGDTVAGQQLDQALPTCGVAGAVSLSLVQPVADSSSPSRYRATVDLRPYSAVIPDVMVGGGSDSDSTRQLNWWIASDLTSMVTGGALRPDHVLGVGGASTSLLEMTIRKPFTSALDMGCGCGIQAMHLATHCERVVATDLSERACQFTRFNAALNDMQIDVRAGSLFEPVAGQTFDLIVTNPPFVITPDVLRGDGDDLLEYRDGGMSRDELVRTVIQMGPDYLVPGGYMQMIGNWEIPADVDPDSGWSDRLKPWFSDRPVDAWIVQRDVLDPAQYVEMWLQDADPHDADSEADAELDIGESGAMVGVEDPFGLVDSKREIAYAKWLADFDSANVGAVGMGFVAMRRLDADEAGGARGIQHFDLELTGRRPLGADVERTLDALRLPDDLGALTLVRADDVTEERHFVPGTPDPNVMIMHQGSGLGRSIMVGTAVSAIVGACDGELEVGQISAAVAMLTDREISDVRAEVDTPLRALIRAGMLEVATCSKQSTV